MTARPFPASLPALCALLLAPALLAQQPELAVRKETGPRDKRVNAVFLCDGYTASQKSLCISDIGVFSDAVVTKDPPLSGYVNYFNIYGIYVESNAYGNGETYFSARYSPSLPRLLTINSSRALSVIRQLVPEADLYVCIVNAPNYGGSGGAVAVANRTTPAIVAHEVGHSYARLADEYEYAGATPREAANATQQTARTSIRWYPWIAPGTPVPTPETSAYANVIGLFEGAAYMATGWYRPKQNCRMRTNGVPFCSVCAETYILSTYDQVSPVESFSPSNAAPVAFAGRPVALNVVPMRPANHALRVQWFVNGILQGDAAGAAFSKALPNGRHRVVARVSDTTPLVRRDPQGLTRDSVAWTVDVSGSVALRDGPGGAGWPSLIGIERQALHFRLPEAGPYQILVRGLDGTLVRELRGEGVRGLNAVPWGQGAPVPGRTIATLESGGKTAKAWLRVE